MKCQAPPMCRKCTNCHRTLLQRDVSCLPQRKFEKEDDKEETHVAALSDSEQVLLMIWKVKVIIADGSSTIARAVIDPGFSALFVHQRLAQNARVEGVAGTSTPT